MEDWIQIREWSRQGVSLTEIARRSGHDPKTIRKVLRSELPALSRQPAPPRPTKLAPFHAYLDERLAQGCDNASVLLDELVARGYTGKHSQLRAYLHPFRLARRRQAEATVRFETAPGQQAQVDWGEFGSLYDLQQERWQKLHGFVFTLGYSRALFLRFTVSEDVEHFLDAHLGAFAALGIPHVILYDNLKTAILGRAPDGTPCFPGRFLDFALYHGFQPRFCQPYRPRTKGKVERSIRYVRDNFWPRVQVAVQAGTLDLAGLNTAATQWVETVALQRVHGTTHTLVAARLTEEQPHLGTLTGRAPYDTSYHSLRRVGRDGRFSYRGQLYQLGLRHALTTVTVRESLSDALQIDGADGERLRWTRVERTALLQPLPEPSAKVPQDATALTPTAAAGPTIPVRDLRVYEEVARGAAAG